MRNPLIGVGVVIFIVLVFGGYAAANGLGLPTVEQVSDPRASVFELTDSKLTLFALAAIGSIAAVAMTGVGITGLFWFLSREVKKVETEPGTPFSFSLNPEGNSVGAMIQQNSFMIAITIGILLIMLFVGLILFTGALA